MRPTQDIRPDRIGQIQIPTPVLYRCYDRDQRLLYIGMTAFPSRRFKQHRRGSSWWNQVDRIDLSSYRNFRVLEQAEIRAIRVEKPKFNVVGRETLAPGRRAVHLAAHANKFGTIADE